MSQTEHLLSLLYNSCRPLAHIATSAAGPRHRARPEPADILESSVRIMMATRMAIALASNAVAAAAAAAVQQQQHRAPLPPPPAWCPARPGPLPALPRGVVSVVQTFGADPTGEALSLPCVATAYLAKAVHLPCTSAAVVVKTLPS